MLGTASWVISKRLIKGVAFEGGKLWDIAFASFGCLKMGYTPSVITKLGENDDKRVDGMGAPYFTQIHSGDLYKCDLLQENLFLPSFMGISWQFCLRPSMGRGGIVNGLLKSSKLSLPNSKIWILGQSLLLQNWHGQPLGAGHDSSPKGKRPKNKKQNGFSIGRFLLRPTVDLEPIMVSWARAMTCHWALQGCCFPKRVTAQAGLSPMNALARSSDSSINIKPH